MVAFIGVHFPLCERGAMEAWMYPDLSLQGSPVSKFCIVVGQVQ